MISYKNLISILALLLCAFISKAQQDCFDAIKVCSPSYTQSNAFAGAGSVSEIPNGSSCLDGGESNSVWYIFTVINPGQLTFQLTPNVATDDYDFAVYDLTTDSCAGIVNGTNTPVSCNYSATTGATGLSTGFTQTVSGSSDPNQCAPLDANSGQTFALMVSNFTSSQSGYQLDFGGSASIVDQNAPSVNSVDQDGQCSPTQVYLEMNEPVDCGSVQFSGGDFSINGPQAVTILSATTIACNSEGFSTTIRIVFSAAISSIGTYTISATNGVGGSTVEDFCGNEIPAGPMATFDVVAPGPVVTVQNVVNTDCGQSNGSASLDIQFGTPPYNISWSTGTNQNLTSVDNLTSGTYFVTVGDQNGCTANGNFSIINTSSHAVNASNVVGVTCNSSTDGSAEIQATGGSGNYTYSWNSTPPQTGQTANNLPGGNVSVTVTDNASGCTITSSISIPRPASISIPVTTVQPGCGASDGEATASPTGGNGGFTYIWNTTPVQTMATATGLSAGVYDVSVIDVLGCSQSTTVLITDDNPPAASIVSTTPDCLQSTGEATAQATTGAAPFTYEWNTTPPQNGATATSLDEGDYFVTITDATGCVQIINVKIDQVPPPDLSANLIQPGCGLSNGGIEALVTDGIAPFTYVWSSSANTTSVEAGLAEGSYTVTVTDDIGCTDTETFLLEQLEPQSDFTSDNVCFGEQTSFSSTTTSGATMWTWDFGDGNTSNDEFPTHTYAAPGDYDVTLTLEGGCETDIVTETSTVFSPPVVSFVIAPEIPTTASELQFVYTGTGGNQFDWDFGEGNTSTEESPSYQYEEDGFYTVLLEATDANGCDDTSSFTFEVLLQPVIYLPNAFTPTGTFDNSRFRGYGIGVTEAEISIFNRWGSLVYYSDNVNEILRAGWDGTFNGKALNQGVYAYKLKAGFYNGKTFEKLGTVTLIQ